MLKNLIFFINLLFFFVSNEALGFFELSANYSYHKRLYGSTNQNSVVSRGYRVSLAKYLFAYTGIELNYSQEEEIITENGILSLGQGIVVDSIQNNVDTSVFGVGLRQALASSKSFIVPVLSAGYAKEVKTGSTTVSFDDNGQRSQLKLSNGKVTSDAVFGTFMLKIRISQLISINGTVNTVFKAFEYNEAKNNLRYGAGLSWIF